MELWLKDNIIGTVGIFISGIIAYHVYYLSKKITFKDKLSHKDNIRNKVESILEKIRQGRRRKVELVNIKKYSKYYPHNNESNKHGYTYLGAELKALRFDGVEFFCGIREAHKIDSENYVFEKENNNLEAENIYEVGVIPFEWIEHIDLQGDEFSWRPQFFVEFNGKDKYPYKYLRYYTKSNVYREGNDPKDMQWKLVNIKS